MCFPLLAIAAVASIGLGVVNTVMAADAAHKNAQSQKDQLAIQAQTNEKNAALAKQNADLALSSADANAKGVLAINAENNTNLAKITAENNANLGKINAENNTNLAKITGGNNTRLLAVTEDNNKQLLAVTQTNANARQQITDVNVALATSISNFNDQVADSNGKMLIGRGELEAAASELNATTARKNAGYQEQAAQDALVASGREEQGSRLNYARLKSTQRANLSANGVALDEGSALRIQTDTDYFSDVDGATIHANGIRAAMGYRQQESNSLVEAGEADIGAKVARINAATEAASVAAQAMGARIATGRDILNMKMSTSFDILQAEENARLTVAHASADAKTRIDNANAVTEATIANNNSVTAANIDNARTRTEAQISNNDANARVTAANYLNQGRVEATNYEMQAGGFSGAADAETVAGNGINPGMAGLGALVGGAASVAGKWFTYQQAGVFG